MDMESMRICMREHSTMFEMVASCRVMGFGMCPEGRGISDRPKYVLTLLRRFCTMNVGSMKLHFVRRIPANCKDRVEGRSELPAEQ